MAWESPPASARLFDPGNLRSLGDKVSTPGQSGEEIHATHAKLEYGRTALDSTQDGAFSDLEKTATGSGRPANLVSGRDQFFRAC